MVISLRQRSRCPITANPRLDRVGQLVCYLGDARFNMADSYLIGGAEIGMDRRIASPRSLWPRQEILDLARQAAAASGAKITLTEHVDEALKACDVLLTDVWVSMGEPADREFTIRLRRDVDNEAAEYDGLLLIFLDHDGNRSGTTNNISETATETAPEQTTTVTHTKETTTPSATT